VKPEKIIQDIIERSSKAPAASASQDALDSDDEADGGSGESAGRGGTSRPAGAASATSATASGATLVAPAARAPSSRPADAAARKSIVGAPIHLKSDEPPPIPPQLIVQLSGMGFSKEESEEALRETVRLFFKLICENNKQTIGSN